MSAAVLVAVNVAAFAFVAWFAWWWGSRNRRPIRQVMAEESPLWVLWEIAHRPCEHADAAFSCPDLPIDHVEWCSSCIAHEALNLSISSTPVSSTPGVEAAHPRNNNGLAT